MTTVDEILELFAQRGDSRYGGEAVSQRAHALQAATLAEQSGAAPDLIAAALLHDVGHLLHDLPADAPDRGTDDRHETTGWRFLQARFPPAVVEPVRLHVAAKRYLCAVDPEYLARLSRSSVVSLSLQGGPMSDREIDEFRENPFHDDAVRLRSWDDAAKDPELATPPLAHFAACLAEVAREESV
jgi:[1-hydroxy-2-(trimethylamino)ethyl]phosphonate dioxygenase